MNGAAGLAAYIFTLNSGRFIRRTLESVLAQSAEVELEVVVIDRGSTDDTLAIVSSLENQQCRLIRTEPGANISQCHNLAIRATRAPIAIPVKTGDVVLPGAFRKIFAVFQQSSEVGLVHGYWFDIDEDGNTTREAFRQHRDFLIASVRPGMDYKRQLLRSDWVLGPLRAYRRDALETAFDESQQSWAEYHAALKIAERWRISLAPEMLCARKSTNALKRSTPVSTNLLRARWRRRFSRSLNWFHYRALYWLRWWPIDPLRWRQRSPATPLRRIGYYIWQFPVHSQTFIHRELATLAKAGIDVSIVADGAENPEIMDHNARLVMKQVTYLQPIDNHRLRQYKRFFLRTRPVLYLNLLFYVITRAYRENKNIHDDGDLFSRAVYLAGVLKSHQIDHVHAPWADESAMIALVAARLLGTTYSVQARAHDIHRNTCLYALREKFENAEFIVTNTEYNRTHLQQMLDARDKHKVVLIHNGLDLERFNAPPADHGRGARCRILSVGRLIEQKGFEYLLKACGLLRNRGFDFECEIIGGPELPLYSEYFVRLKILHKQLHLEDCVTFSGTQPLARVVERYAAADIFVLPCVIARDGSRDITPNSLIEAMAMRLAVISTTTTGVPEIVEDGVSGILTPPADEASLADAIARLFADPDLRERLGCNARKRVENKFDISRNIVRYVDLFSRRMAP